MPIAFAYTLIVLLIITSMLLTLLILLHRGKGGGLSSMFGGGVTSSLAGSSVAEKNLDRYTVLVGIVWFACIVGLGPVAESRTWPADVAVLSRRSSVVDSAARSGYSGSRRLFVPLHRVATPLSPDGRPPHDDRSDIRVQWQRDPRQPGRFRPDAARRACEPAPRREVTYWCANGHAVEVRFAADVAPPATWDCPRCGQPAGLDAAEPARAGTRAEPYKTHLAYVKERRSDEDGAAILAEALAKLRQRRGRALAVPTRAPPRSPLPATAGRSS